MCSSDLPAKQSSAGGLELGRWGPRGSVTGDPEFRGQTHTPGTGVREQTHTHTQIKDISIHILCVAKIKTLIMVGTHTDTQTNVFAQVCMHSVAKNPYIQTQK